jgi:hypothetical protein
MKEDKDGLSLEERENKEEKENHRQETNHYTSTRATL